MKTTDFLENYLPNYSSSQRIADIDDLSRFILGELTEEEITNLKFENITIPEAFNELNRLNDIVFSEALKNYSTFFKAEL